MPVPSSISDLSTTPALNSPPGSESPSSIDDYLRTHAAFIKQVNDLAATKADDSAVVKLTGAQTVAGVKTFSSPIVADLTGTAATVVDSAITTAKIVDGAVTTPKLADGVATPAGQVALYARSTAPTGWLKANGAAISRTTYAALFTAIGTTFGAGDGSTTFNLPDLRGEFVRSLDDGRGVDSGRVLGSWQTGQIESHSHALPRESGGSENIQSLTTTQNDDEGISPLSQTGLTGGDETRPRNVALLACIKF
jgi:microcystin-dependent protein